MKAWKVYCDSKYIGIIETNYEFAYEYWKKRSQSTGKKYTLKIETILHKPSKGMNVISSIA